MAGMQLSAVTHASAAQRTSRRARTAWKQAQHSSRCTRMYSKKPGLGDELLDYITAGPKLRKWYGEGERLPRDGGVLDEESSSQADEGEVSYDDGGVKDRVLVTDVDSDTAEQLLLQLILARQKVKAVFKDAEKGVSGFGPYVEVLRDGDIADAAAVRRALMHVRSIVFCGAKVSASLLAAAQRAGVQHVVVLSSAGVSKPAGLLGGLFGGEDNSLRDPQREAVVRDCGIPYTIVRSSGVRDVLGGVSALEFSQDGSGARNGGMSREDLAVVLARCLQFPPQGGLVFEVSSIGRGSLPDDWRAVFASLDEQSTAAAAAMPS